MSAVAGIDTAIEFIRLKGATRTPALAAVMGLGEAAIDAMLEPARLDGRLNHCLVTVGERQVIEYRCSANGGRISLRATAGRTPPQRISTPTTPDRVTPPARDDADTKGERTMTVRDQIEAALKEHGPLDTRALRKFVNAKNLSTIAANLVKHHVLRKLGGGPRSAIYGLPGQTLADRKEQPAVDGVDMHAVHRRRATKPARKRKAARKAKRPGGSKAAKKAWKTRRANGGGVGATKLEHRFRPALAADGALLFMGAKGGDFEIPVGEARALVKLVRRLTGPELALAVGFVERLDRAEVSA